MNPKHDGSSEIEPPMTRALFATDLDDSLGGAGLDPDGTIGEETHQVASETAFELPKPPTSLPSQESVAQGSMAQGSGSQGSGSAWSTGGVTRRGIVGKIEPGQVLYSKYQVLKKLGSGAMGEVWLVRHVTLKSEHALKVIIPNFASNPVALMRFQRELEVMATLRQEHAVSIFDAFMDEDGGYIDMEYLDGLTIQEVLQSVRNRPDHDPTEPLMPLDWIVRILDQLCEVLQVAHSKGIVHRDLKPSNMMLLNGRKPGKESLKVLDFGIAKIRDDPDSAAARDVDSESNKTQGFIGTPSYASPEQAMVLEDVDGRSDLYSVGVMLYEFVTGRLPFRGNHWQVMSQTATVTPPPFAEANPKLRPLPELEHAILRILSKKPDDRPQTALELFDEIRDAVEAAMPVGSPGLTPPTWEAVPLYAPPSGTEMPLPTLLPTERESQFGKEPVSTQAATLMGGELDVAPAKFGGESPSNLGPVIDDRPVKTGPKIAAIVGLLLVSFLVVAVLIGILDRNRRRVESPPKTARTKPTFERYWPSNYLPVGDESADQVWPKRVRRTSDEVFFNRFAEGIYLPEGYKIENPTDLVDGWPRVISREGIRFIRIAGEEVWAMGDWAAPAGAERADAPAHAVILTGYYIQETEVTNGQFEDYLRKTETPRPSDWEAAYRELRNTVGAEDARKHPAVSLSHKMAQVYADYMDGQLPTEAQWEFAARSRGEKRRYVWGDTPSPNRDLANIDGLDASKTTAPVKSYVSDKTVQGLFDMMGNVQEMCRDCFESYKKTTDPVRDPCVVAPGGSEGIEYMIRGASFTSFGGDCMTTRRDDHRPANDLVANLGFRLVVECPDTRKPR